MKYKLCMLSGLVVLAVVGLGLLSGVFANRTVEAAKPLDYFSHVLESTTGCELTTDVNWDSKAFAHKKGYYRLFLWGEDETGRGVRLASYVTGPIDKGTTPLWIHQDWGSQRPGEEYHARIVLYSSKGKDGAQWGRRLLLDDRLLSC